MTLATEQGEIKLTATVTDQVPEGAVFVPLLWNGGAVTALFPDEGSRTGAPRVRVLVPAKV